MKIAVIGTTGFVGKSITKELANREHEITGISRNVSTTENPNLTYISADVTDVAKLAEILKGNDVVVSAYSSGWGNPNLHDDFISGSKAIQEAVKQAGVNRFVVIGGAGSLYIADGVQLVDTNQFPEEYKPVANAAREYLNVLKNEKDLDWVCFSPAIEMHPGITTGRTGKYRLGNDAPIFDQDSRSILSVEDVAVVIADEIENPKHHKARFTAAY